MFVIVFGVTGAGKSTIGGVLAKQLGWQFYDADDYHSAANIAKMRQGMPLSDEDRRIWLAQLRRLIEECTAKGENGVLACSALKLAYRRYLRVGDAVRYAYLKAERAWIVERLRNRHGHFMNPVLLQSQFAILQEPPAGTAVVVDAAQSPQQIVQRIRKELSI